jgi:hypothetical protein
MDRAIFLWAMKSIGLPDDTGDKTRHGARLNEEILAFIGFFLKHHPGCAWIDEGHAEIAKDLHATIFMALSMPLQVPWKRRLKKRRWAEKAFDDFYKHTAIEKEGIVEGILTRCLARLVRGARFEAMRAPRAMRRKEEELIQESLKALMMRTESIVSLACMG